MKKMIKKLLTTLVIFALVFTCFPVFTGELEANAAAKPARVKSISVGVKEQTMTIKWGKVKNCSGYTLYRNGKAIKDVPKSITKYVDKGLEPSKKYKYYVKAYKNVMQKQWLNAKTGKWQTKKIKKAQTRKVSVRLYGKASPSASKTTGKLFDFYSLYTEWDSYTVSFTVTDFAVKGMKLRFTRPGMEPVTLDENDRNFMDIGLRADTTYEYTIEVIVNGQVKRTAKKQVHTKEGATIEIKWLHFKGANKYEIYRDDDIYVATIEKDAIKPNSLGYVCFKYNKLEGDFYSHHTIKIFFEDGEVSQIRAYGDI